MSWGLAKKEDAYWWSESLTVVFFLLIKDTLVFANTTPQNLDASIFRFLFVCLWRKLIKKQKQKKTDFDSFV